MTEKLDHFDPTLEMILGIKRQLLQAGIPEEEIPYDWLRSMIAATCKWFITTQDGLEHFSRLFCFDLKAADDDKDYLLVDNINRTTIALENKQVTFFEGVMVDGRPVAIADTTREGPIPALELEFSDSSKNQCEDCGIVSHCLKEIRVPFTEKLMALCNYCLTYHVHPRVSEQGGTRICQECTVTSCRHHPASTRRRTTG